MFQATADIATRVFNHNWKIDPIVRSLIDTDFYKLLMCQFVQARYPDTKVRFGLINRSQNIRLGELIDEGELREQLDHIRTLPLTRGESTWLRGNVFYGVRRMFRPEFIDWLEGLRLPPYRFGSRDGQIELEFEGSWPEVMMWEIPALAVVTELRSRAILKAMGRFELQILYARAMTRVWKKIKRLNRLEKLRLADFGTRRRHSYLWQDWCVVALIEGLGDKFIGTSNCLIALRREVEAIGTSAHELPMVYCALSEDDQSLAQAPYRLMEDWQQDYAGNLRIILSDTYGTAQLLERSPDWMAKWTGIRIDSGDAAAMARKAIDWWRASGEDVSEKLVIFSDGLDVPAIERLHAEFSPQVRLSFGWGTLLTNDFRKLTPDDGLAPFSLVCKVLSANGKPTVKLTDNPQKATGNQLEIERYRRIFGRPATVA